MCSGKFIYEFILEPFFKCVYLETLPQCYLDLYQNCKSVIAQKQLYTGCSNIDSILCQNLTYYIQDYEF